MVLLNKVLPRYAKSQPFITERVSEKLKYAIVCPKKGGCYRREDLPFGFNRYSMGFNCPTDSQGEKRR